LQVALYRDKVAREGEMRVSERTNTHTRTAERSQTSETARFGEKIPLGLFKSVIHWLCTLVH